ncbi:MAG: ATP-binding protein [Gammaproteobacteria bacterium]|nr:ATP-binding protein [Gammaproteobacteria bacterium]
MDGELLVDFLEEAAEIVRSVGRYARAWRGDPQNPLYPQSLRESLHMLKGGALLCGFYDICRLVHQLEDLLAESRLPNRRVGEPFLRQLDARRGELSRLLSLARETAGLDRAGNEGLGRDAVIPVSRMLPRLRVCVQRLSRMLGKSVELHVGEVDFDLDAGVVRRLAMALEHVLSDAVCHGIESPRRRRALGKAATGRIDLWISRREDSLVIEVEDDGRGIDAARVRELAGASGLLARDAKLVDADCAQFVFAPGLSTSGRVRPAYGRGMGLSATRSGIARLGGRIAVDYRPGWGARFVARIPMGIRVERAWIFSVGNDRYALPDAAVEEGVPVVPESVSRMADDGYFKYRGEAWEFRFPGELLGVGRKSGAGSVDGAVLLLRHRDRRTALYADAVRDRQDVVVGCSGTGSGVVPGLTLATVLDEGSLVALLNPGALLESDRDGNSSRQ